MNKQDVLQQYIILPEETDPTITVLLRDIVINVTLDDIEHNYLSKLDDKSIEENIRFYIYYSISIFYRRYEYHSRFLEMVKKYSKEFYSHQLNNVILSLYYKYGATDQNYIDNFKYAIRYAWKAVTLLPKNSAVINNYAEIIAVAIDEGFPVQRERIMEAIDLLDRIISFNEAYAKWYYTKGKLLFSVKEYNEARECIRRAIDLETSDKKDSLLRIAQYNNTLLDFRTKEAIDKIEQNLRVAKKEIIQINDEQDKRSKSFLAELDIVKSKYLEYLAFFASVISLITASINIVTTYGDAMTAGGLIVVLAGALSASFCIFRMLISYNRKMKKGIALLSILFSLLLMVVGFAICIIWR